MTKCQHERTTEGTHYCYVGSVAVHPYTDENRVAHGNITYTETCLLCGSERAVNENAGQHEYSTWGPTRAQREEQERRAQERREAEQLQKEDAAVAAQRAHILDVCADSALVSVAGRPAKWLYLDDIRAASQQTDNGDGLVPFYRGLRRAIKQFALERRWVHARGARCGRVAYAKE